jgi:hypothetical protein
MANRSSRFSGMAPIFMEHRMNWPRRRKSAAILDL